MAEPFKNLFNAELIHAMAGNLARTSDQFDGDQFLGRALGGLDDLELMERSEQILRALTAAYAIPFSDAVDAMLAALHPQTDAELSDMRSDESGIAGWAVMPMAGFVARHGLDTPEFSLAALREMTMRSSSEFAVRPFFRDHPDRTLKVAADWAADPNLHVRRLASEGSRPRLPWGIKLHGFVKQPSLILPLLTTLRDDPSEYVRRSVANNLNDIAKDHPDLVADLAAKWLKSADENRVRLVKHACRTLLKNGHPDALNAFGFSPPNLKQCKVTLSSDTVIVGDKLGISLTLLGGDKPQDLLIDYVIHFMRANGKLSPKVFKWTKITLQPGEARTLVKSHAYRKVTTRKDYPGRQHVSVRINGQDFDGPAFELSL
ncbi:MAG: DNA alkylation repair protein [Marinosulfonomonas sp.]|nr:DNA alkylation repair protein [Marinosulfonomonas sp.]